MTEGTPPIGAKESLPFSPRATFREFSQTLQGIQSGDKPLPLGQRHLTVNGSLCAHISDQRTNYHVNWPRGLHDGSKITSPELKDRLTREGIITVALKTPDKKEDPEYWIFGSPRMYKESLAGRAVSTTLNNGDELPLDPTLYRTDGTGIHVVDSSNPEWTNELQTILIELKEQVERQNRPQS